MNKNEGQSGVHRQPTKGCHEPGTSRPNAVVPKVWQSRANNTSVHL